MFNEKYFVGCSMSGPTRFADYTAERPQELDVSDLVRRTNDLNIRVLNGDAGEWRLEANSIGSAIYKTLADERRILQELGKVQTLSQQTKDLWLEFSGPAPGLEIPFELLRDGKDPLCLRNIFTRRLVQQGVDSRNLDPFHKFIQRLQKNDETLRLLIVGSNSDGHIPGAEDEATKLKLNIESDLQNLGIDYEINPLIGNNATYENVKEALTSGGYHIFHYAGHGRFSDDLPEVSGLILLGNGSPKVLSAADLNLFVQDSDLQFVFLSCCLGARTDSSMGRGDFLGTMEALARADVPVVLGYRWTVADEPALFLATEFYEMLWQTFSPAESLMEARRNVATGTNGRDDDTWLSPVLLVQNR